MWEINAEDEVVLGSNLEINLGGFKEISEKCPWKDDMGDCTAQIYEITSSRYNDTCDRSKESCKEQFCAVWHFVQALFKMGAFK